MVDCKALPFVAATGVGPDGPLVPTAVNYAEYGQYPTGYVNLIGRVKWVLCLCCAQHRI